MLKKILSLVLMLYCFLVIFYFSHQNSDLSSNLSKMAYDTASGFTLFNWLFSVFPIRKVAHFCLYALTSLAIYSFISSWFNLKVAMKNLVTIGVVFIYACSDEFHQSFIVGRSSEFRDVLIDCSGAICVLICIAFIRKIHLVIRERKKNAYIKCTAK